MADIDLKTSTPDTSLPTTGFLFGADSQAAPAPSVFTTQAVATTLLGSTTLSGATITADAPVLNMSQTWNNSGVTFTGLRFNAATGSSANSAAGSLLMDLQLEGASRFSVRKNGSTTVGGTGLFRPGAGGYIGDGGAQGILLQDSTLANSVYLGATANGRLRLGAADAAAPVAQTLSVQSVVAGTTNTAGANLTITGSQGTGTGAGGSIIFQVAPAGSSGTAQNALATALTIGGDRRLSFPDGTFIINDAPTGASNQIGIWAGGVFGLNRGGGNASQIVLYANGVSGLVLNGGTSGGAAPYLSFASPTAGTHDIFITRDTSNTLALRNGTNAQAFRVYNTTDGTNSEFVSLFFTGDIAFLRAAASGTGSQRSLRLDGLSVVLQTGGGNRWQVDASGHFLAVGDNTYDIGASGANRPRNVYVAGSIAAGGAISVGSSNTVSWNAGGSYIFGNAATGSNSGTFRFVSSGGTPALNFGGDTSSFPALKRSTTTLQVRLADDSAFASVQGKLTTDTAYAAGDPTTTGYLVVYDSTGTAYKIPAVAV